MKPKCEKPYYPSLTIGLLTCNRAGSGYLRESLEAILTQTYTHFELLVLDNHSTDETAKLVLGYKDPRMIYIRQPPDKTPATNFNSAMWMGRGQYILATHDDDVMEPDMIQRMMDFLVAHPNLACLATNVGLIDTRGSLIQPRLYDMDEDRVFQPGSYLGTYLDEKLWLPTPTCMFLRDKIVGTKQQYVRDTEHVYQPSGDILVLCLLNMKHPIALMSDPLLRYRQHSGQESRNVNQSEPLLATVTELLRYRRNPQLKTDLPALHAAHARFEAQNRLLKSGGGSKIGHLVRQMGGLKHQWEKAVDPESRAMDSVLPFEILLCQLGLGHTISVECMERLKLTKARGGARRGYRDWVFLVHQERTLFDGHPEIRRIAILGSMFTAHLIALDARKAGVEVVCYLDSAPARLGRKVFGIPVVPHETLKGITVDAVVLSSERDHETGLQKILEPNLPFPQLPTPSWKELARESLVFEDAKGA